MLKRNLSIITLFFISGLSSQLALADIYKCVSSSGKISYSEKRCDTGLVKKNGQWLGVKQHEEHERAEVLRREKLQAKLQAENERIDKLRREKLRVENERTEIVRREMRRREELRAENKGIRLLGAKKHYPDNHPSGKNDVSHVDAAWIGKTSVKALFKNPEAAEFRNIEYIKFKTGGFICGEVNSKNSFNGYSGWQHFISAGSQTAYLEEQIQGFKGIWRDYCAGKPW